MKKKTNGRASSRVKSDTASAATTRSGKTAADSGNGIMMGNDYEMIMQLFLEELKDIYWAEKYIVKNLPKMSKASSSQDLANAFDNHLKESQVHVERVEKAFELLNKKATGKKCDAMEGLIEEAKEVIEETEKNSLQRDIGLITAAQKIEHYEIATYGTLSALASMLGHGEVAAVLTKTLDEEKSTDVLLTKITEDQFIGHQRAY